MFHVKTWAPGPAVEAELESLQVRYGLGEGQRRRLTAILGYLAVEEHVPTAVWEPEDAVRVHLADSLVALELEEVRGARVITDLGAGAGFPGLPLAVALPEAEVRLVESQRSKCLFIEGARRVAEAQNAAAVCARAEEWKDGIDAHDLILARAIATQPVVLEYAAPLLRRDGVLVDWRGARNPASEAIAGCAAKELGMQLREIRRVVPYNGAREHHLHIWMKAAQTPARFPRRPGVARKRPLGC